MVCGGLSLGGGNPVTKDIRVRMPLENETDQECIHRSMDELIEDQLLRGTFPYAFLIGENVSAKLDGLTAYRNILIEVREDFYPNEMRVVTKDGYEKINKHRNKGLH